MGYFTLFTPELEITNQFLAVCHDCLGCSVPSRDRKKVALTQLSVCGFYMQDILQQISPVELVQLHQNFRLRHHKYSILNL